MLVVRDAKKASARETFLAFVLVLAVGFMNFHAEIIDEYRWNGELETEYAAVGWEILARSPAPSLVFPWTMIWKPAGAVTMAHPVLTKKFYRDDDSRGYMITTIVTQFTRDDHGRLAFSELAELVNCRAKTFAIAGDVKEKKRFAVLSEDGTPLPGRWQPAPAEVLSYFCKSSKS